MGGWAPIRRYTHTHLRLAQVTQRGFQQRGGAGELGLGDAELLGDLATALDHRGVGGGLALAGEQPVRALLLLQLLLERPDILGQLLPLALQRLVRLVRHVVVPAV